MGGGLLNLVATGELNKILNGNPQKTFFKTTYAKYRNFGLQRFRLPYRYINELSLFTNSIFEFVIPNNGDMLLDTFFSFKIPDIYSPIYTIPRANQQDENGNIFTNLMYCQPYEFKWVENLGAQIIKKVTYLIDGRPIQEYSGQYLYCKSKRDLSSGKLKLFNEMIGNITEMTDPANFSNNNGNYPSVSWGGLSESEWPNGLEPSIRGRRLYVPLYLWETFSSYMSFPLLALYYSKLEIHIECRPLSEVMVVRNLDYFHDWISKLDNDTQMPRNLDDVFKYYDPPYTQPNFNDERYNVWFFLRPPPQRSFCLGDVSFNMVENVHITDQIQAQMKKISRLHYSATSNLWNAEVSLFSTFAFLSEEERIQVAAKPHQYLVKRVYEKTIYNVQGVHRENVNANGLTVSWMWFFQRSDVVLRNEWSNYSNWDYNNKMPYPCVLSMDISYTLIDIPTVNTAYITPTHFMCGNNISDYSNPCMQYITGPTHPRNERNIMINWGLYCNELERESILPFGINDYLEKYLRVEGNPEDGIYCYNFNIEKNISLNPSGAMNMSKFTDVAFEFTTINPYREMLPPTENLYNEVISDPDPLKFSINENCINNGNNFMDASFEPDHYLNNHTPGGEIHTLSNVSYTDFDYNFNLHIMEERYNVIQFSSGMARYLFPN